MTPPNYGKIRQAGGVKVGGGAGGGAAGSRRREDWRESLEKEGTGRGGCAGLIGGGGWEEGSHGKGEEEEEW